MDNQIVVNDEGTFIADNDSDLVVTDRLGCLNVMTTGPLIDCGECSRYHIVVLMGVEARLALARAVAPPGYLVVPADDVTPSARNRESR